ncbi:ABC transporter permease [Furfurilactobacillus cerevisiae]|uniref:ABC transporter permease n=1 Tax=Furfurilactobacillus rossiae TaxID=231049 RepID=UPI003B986D2B
MVNVMTDLQKLFSQRLSRHAGQLLKYLRLVFTDHFVIALFFFFGALGFAYQNELKTLTLGVWWGPWLTMLILVITLQMGRLATLLEPADAVFLLPAETTLHQYLKHARNYSLLMASFIQIAVGVVLLPFLARGDQMTLLEAAILIMTQLITKAAWMNWQLQQGVQQVKHSIAQVRLVNWLGAIVIFGLSLFLSVWVGLIAALLALSVSSVGLGKRWHNGQLAWQSLITNENGRMMVLYRFFNLFTDVPQVKATVRRRRYLDPLWKLVIGHSTNPYLFLFTRGLGRDSDTFGLITRLTVMGMIILIFLTNQWASLVVMLLAIYLIGFQLLPFYREYEGKVFTHLFPVTKGQQLSAFKTVLTDVLTICAVLFVIVDVAVNWSWLRLLIDVVAMAAELIIFIGWYSGWHLRKS